MTHYKAFKLHYGAESIWTVTTFTNRAGYAAAKVYADGRRTLSKVIFARYASKADKVNVLAACVEWANQTWSLAIQPADLEHASLSDAERASSRKERGQIKPLTQRQLLKYRADELSEFITGYKKPVYGFSLQQQSYRNLSHAARCINDRGAIKGKAKVTLTTPYPRWQERAVVTVKVTDPLRNFEFWSSMSMPSQPSYEDICLDVIPAYHPCRTRGREQIMLINGATEALITGHSSVKIYPPESARRDSKYDHINTSHRGTWSHVMHPVVATGKSFTMELDAELLLTRAGADLMVDIITTALDDTKDYIGVSGGFNPPEGYPYPPGAQSRGATRSTGAEHMMAWTYHILEEEGALADAFVPRWFTQQKWLDYYAASRDKKAVPRPLPVS